MDNNVNFRKPTIADGAGMWRIVQESGVLDPNSAYLYLLLCKDFADTCIVAERDDRLVGFATGYRPPGRPDVVFLWQIGVDAATRGQGLGKRLLAGFLRQASAGGTSLLETTISPSNQASQALFRGVARDLGTDCKVLPCFPTELFPSGGHEAEDLYRIGPFDAAAVDRLSV
jgi:L-2,4-diaminobutyric acid acetyltransferase